MHRTQSLSLYGPKRREIIWTGKILSKNFWKKKWFRHIGLRKKCFKKFKELEIPTKKFMQPKIPTKKFLKPKICIVKIPGAENSTKNSYSQNFPQKSSDWEPKISTKNSWSRKFHNKFLDPKIPEKIPVVQKSPQKIPRAENSHKKIPEAENCTKNSCSPEILSKKIW